LLVAGGVSLVQAANRNEIFIMTIHVWKNLLFQDVAKTGLNYGDDDPEAEKKRVDEYTQQYRLLLDLLTKKTNDLVKEVIIPNHLGTSPCAIVVDGYGYSTNMEKLLGEHKCLSL